MSGTGHAAPAGPGMPEAGLVGIYLNDHLAGSTAGVELFRRATRSLRGTAAGETLARLTEEVTADRESLRAVMRTLGVPERQYKVYSAWAIEKVARLKPNGRLRSRSPLSTLIELETLVLGVAGKSAGWLALRTLAERDSRIDVAEVDRLVARARNQAEVLEQLRTEAAENAFVQS